MVLQLYFPAQEPRPTDLLPVFDAFKAEARFYPVAASAKSVAETVTEARKPFLPELVLLVGASGSGRGEFSSR